MATHINTTNAIKGLTCAIECLNIFGFTPFAQHAIKHLTDAATEIERLNNENIKFRHENSQLKEKLNNKTADFDKLADELRESYSWPGGAFVHAVAATEADRKEALRTAEAFQKVQPKAEPVKDVNVGWSNHHPFDPSSSSDRSFLVCEFTHKPDTCAHYIPISIEIVDEAVRASEIHPKWPTDAIHAVSILTEESGELMKAAIEYHYNNGDIEAVREEAIQTGAMALRVLLNIDKYKRPSDEK